MRLRGGGPKSDSKSQSSFFGNLGDLVPLSPSVGKGAAEEKLIHAQISDFGDSDAPALLSPDGSQTSFRDLERKTNQLARELLKLGVVVGSGKPVGVCCDGPISIFGLIAVLKTGNPYVPLDVSYPAGRVAFMAENSEIDLVLTTADVLATGVLSDPLCKELVSQLQVVTLNDKSACWSNSADPIKIPQLQFEVRLCCILYTSGSTGNPKGVRISHKMMMNRFEWMWDEFPFKEGEVFCQKTSYNFVDSVWEVFGGLNKGVPLVLTAREIRADPFALINLLAEHKVSRFIAVPSLLRMMLMAQPDLGSRLPKLKFWTLSGEALPNELCTQFFEACAGTTILNLYGSTECAGDVTYAMFTKETMQAGDSADSIAPIGRAISNCGVFLLNNDFQEVEMRAEGEIFVFGANLAEGYHKRPDANAEQFLTLRKLPGDRRAYERCDPSDVGAERAFRTGDFALAQQSAQDPFPMLFFLGRHDQQIKIRGNRVDLLEVEAQILQAGGVDNACVTSWGNPPREIVAYITPRLPASAHQPIKDKLYGKLAKYMLPSVMIALDELPLLPNGKLDRRKLKREPADPLSPAYGLSEAYISREDRVPDSLDFARRKGGKLSEFDLVRQNCYFAGITAIVMFHNIAGIDTAIMYAAELGTSVFLILAGMSDQKNPPTMKSCMWLLQIIAVYSFVVLPISRSSALAAYQAGFPVDWALSFESETTPAGVHYAKADSYENPSWFLWLLVHLKLLSIACMRLQPKRWTALFASLAFVAFVVYRVPEKFGLPVDLYKQCDVPDDKADHNSLVYSPSCWSTSSWIQTLVVFFLKLLGCGFGEESWIYLRKFIYLENTNQNLPPGWSDGWVSDPQAQQALLTYTDSYSLLSFEHKGNFHMILYAVGLCVPVRLLPSYGRDVFKSGQSLGLFALRILLACYMIACVVPAARLQLEISYTYVTSHLLLSPEVAQETIDGGDSGEFVRWTAIFSALAAIQVVPRVDTFFGEIGMRCLLILLLHHNLWFIKTFLRSDFWLKPFSLDEPALCMAPNGEPRPPRFDQGECSLMVPFTCLLYTCVLGRFTMTRASCIEVLGYMIAWQCLKKVLHYHTVVHSPIGAVVMFVDESLSVLLFVGFFSALPFLYKYLKGLTVDREALSKVLPIDEEDASVGSLPVHAQRAYERAAKWVSKYIVLHKDVRVNTCLVAVQLFLIFVAVQFLRHEVQNDFCAVRITVNGVYTDLSSSKVVQASMGCSVDFTAKVLRQRATGNTTFSLDDQMCLTWWDLTTGLGCSIGEPIPADGKLPPKKKDDDDGEKEAKDDDDKEEGNRRLNAEDDDKEDAKQDDDKEEECFGGNCL